MSKFKTIEKLGLSITTWGGDPRTSAVLAQELETLLQSAQVVYGTKYKNTPDESEWATHQLSQDTHSAILIGITPIKKKTKAEAALEFVEKVVNGDYLRLEVDIKEAKRILEMKD